MSRARRLPLPPHAVAPVVGDPGWRVAWELEFAGPARPVGGYAALPGGLTLARASTADYATSATTTATAQSGEACLYQPTGSPWSRGLLVRPASGGRAAEYLTRSTHADLLSATGRLVLELCVHHEAEPDGTLFQLGTDGYNRATVTNDGAGTLTAEVTLNNVAASGSTTGVPTFAGATVLYRIGMGGGGPLELTAWLASRAVASPDDAGTTWTRYDLVASTAAGGPIAANATALYLLGDDGSAQLDAALRWARVLVAADEVEGAVDPARRTWDWGQVAKPAPLTYVRSGTWHLVSAVDIDATASGSSGLALETTAFGANAWGTAVLAWDDDTAYGYRYTPVMPGHTNLLGDARDVTGASWTAGGATRTADQYASPDGTTSGDRVQHVPASGYGVYQAVSEGGSTPFAWSVWLRRGGGTSASQVVTSDAFANRTFNYVDVTPPVFVRRHGLATSAGGSTAFYLTVASGYDYSGLGGVAPGTIDLGVDLAQLTVSTYARPWTAGTVGPTLLSLAGTDLFGATTGRFDVTLAGAVHALEDYDVATADQYLLYWDANNSLRWDVGDRAFVLRLGGTDRVTSGAQTHASGDDLGEIRVWSSSGSCGFTLDGATYSAAAVAASSVPATAYLFSDNSAAGLFPCRLLGRYWARYAGV